MVAVGDKLGGRFFVTRVDAKPAPGVFVEARDAQGNVFQAQWLHAAPFSGPDLTALAREVATVPASPSLFVPSELTQSSSGQPFALYANLPPPPLADELRLYESVGSAERRRATLLIFLNAFAILAEDYGKAVGARSTHGAIGLAHLGHTGREQSLRLVLSGFGLEAAARLAARKERPLSKADPAAIVLCLYEVLQKTSSLPEGSAAVKWDVLRNCARAGDHPALQSGTTLGRFLRDLAAEIEATPKAPTATKSADVSSKNASQGAGGRGAPTAAKPAAASGGAAGARAFVEKHQRPVALGVLVVGAAAAYFALQDPPRRPAPPPPAAQTTAPGATPGAAPPAACGAEPVANPLTQELSAAAVAVDAVCTPDQHALDLVARNGTVLSAGERSARRGGGFDWGPANVTDDIAEQGTALAADGATWVAWRPRDGAPFGVARLGAAAAAAPVRADAPPTGAFHGAFLLRADAAGAWVASTLDTPAGPVAVAVRLATAAAEPALTIFRLTEGTVEAIIPAEPAFLLVRRSQGRQHTLLSVTVATAILPVLAPAAPSVDGGADARTPPGMRAVPEVALQPTEALTVEGEAVAAATYGAATSDGARHFAVTVGAPAAALCRGAGCVAEGPVSLLTFTPRGPASRLALAASGRGVDVAVNAGGEAMALVFEGAARVLYTRTGDPEPARDAVSLRGLAFARMVSCGGEPWLAFATDANPGRVGAVPVACFSRRATGR